MNMRWLSLVVGLVWAGTAHATVVFEDDFEYTANRADTNVQVPFEGTGGWTDAKANNSDYAGSGGYLYTQDNATLGSKVLVMESLPTTVGGQTSYHLSYGSDAQSLGFIPGNLWIRFWTYAVPGSTWDRQKFLYPCHTSYPCPVDSYLWLVSFNTSDLTGVGDNVVTSPAGGRFFRISSSTANYSGGETWNADKLFQNLSHTPMLEGIWYEVKIHMDTSGAQGTYELWVRQRGVASWTKMAEWIGGVTANFDWPIPEALRAGNKVIAMPTTVDTNDSTTYLDDLMLATTEGDLPVYTPTTAQIAPGSSFAGSVRIQ